MEKKISVIVPIYKVEDYLRKCVDSIVNQTYKNLEIILVDDGSPDSCPQICDELAKTDERIKVVHKENGGLSDARNAGMDVSTGDYIGFVDSDDYVDVKMIECLVSDLEKYEADIACCRFTKVWEDGTQENVTCDHETSVYYGIEGLKQFFWAKTVDPFVCNKIYKAELIGNSKYQKNRIRFVKGEFGEDIQFNISAFEKAQCISQNNKGLYYYLQMRSGAITFNNISDKRIASVFRWNNIRLYIKKRNPELEVYVLRRQVLFYIGLYNRCLKAKGYSKEKKAIKDFIKRKKKIILHSSICEKSIKISVFLLAYISPLYVICMKIYKLIIGEAKL